MANKSKAKLVKRLNNYVGEVLLFELSKSLKKGKKWIVVSNTSPRSGNQNITIWFSDNKGVVSDSKPYLRTQGDSIESVLNSIGYDVA